MAKGAGPLPKGLRKLLDTCSGRRECRRWSLDATVRDAPADLPPLPATPGEATMAEGRESLKVVVEP
jgi:hypothetical protein